MTFEFVTSLLSFILLAGFIALGIRTFGLQRSYSYYAHLWGEKVKIHNVNLWSAVTVISAILLMISLIAKLEGNPWQFLGFLVPAYLIVVAFTPNYLEDNKQAVAHVVATILCAVGFLVYAIVGLHTWKPLVFSLLAFAVIGFASRSLKDSYILWLECTLIMSAYTIAILG